jgi:phosphoglycolate phosphatase
VRDLLVLWDVDFTLLNAGGASRRIYQVVFRQLFGRDLLEVAPMAGRTDRAIVLDTLGMAGISEPHRHVDAFLAALAGQAPVFRAMVTERGHALPGAAAALAAVAALSGNAAPATAAGPHPAPAMAAGPATAAGGDPAITVQSVLTGNVRPIAEAKLITLGLADHLDLDIGAYGDHHEVRAELVHLARRQATLAYGRDFAGQGTVLVGDTPLDVAAARAAGARAVGVATGGFSTTDLTAAGAGAALPDLTNPTAVIAAIVGTRL